MITNNYVGYFKIGGSWQNFAINDYNYKSVQGYGTDHDGCYDGGYDLGKAITYDNNGKRIKNLEITIGALPFYGDESKTEHKNNPNIFYISSDNCSGWYWKDKIRYLIIYSEKFKTKEGIGVGTTLEKLKEIFGKVEINIGWLEGEDNPIRVKVNSYPSIDFILDQDDAIGIDLYYATGTTARVSDFKKDTKIKKLIVEKTTN